MHAPVQYWDKMLGYKKIKIIVRSFEVVNDCAERAIKMITDFKDATQSVEDQEYLLQVVEDHRKRFNVSNKDGLSGVM